MARAAAGSARSDDEAISAVRTVAACAAPTNAHELATMAADDTGATARSPSPFRIVAPASAPRAVTGTRLNAEPTVGSAPLSAGVTPAPSINRKMARTPLCSQVL